MLPTGFRHVPDGQGPLRCAGAGELKGHGLLKLSPFHLRRGGVPDFMGNHTKKEKKGKTTTKKPEKTKTSNQNPHNPTI